MCFLCLSKNVILSSKFSAEYQDGPTAADSLGCILFIAAGSSGSNRFFVHSTPPRLWLLVGLCLCMRLITCGCMCVCANTTVLVAVHTSMIVPQAKANNLQASLGEARGEKAQRVQLQQTPGGLAPAVTIVKAGWGEGEGELMNPYIWMTDELINSII